MEKGSFSVKHKKGSRSFTYTGDLRAAIKKAENELENKQMDTTKRLFLVWNWERAKKELEAWDRRIDDLRAFISVANVELKKQEEGGTSGTE